MPGLKVSLFGKFYVRNGDTSIFAFESRKAEELFCFLLLNRDRPHPRETLADLLWGEDASLQSKSYLRKALWQLQSTLDHFVSVDDERLLLVEAEWIQINPDCDLWLDVAEVEAAFSDVKGISGRDLTPEQAQSLEIAVKLYRGDLLEGCYTNWCLFERERLQYMVIASLDKLMDYCEWHYEYESGLGYGEQVLRYDRARERTHARLMRLYYLVGDRTAALRQYERCKSTLQEELGIEPGRLTRQLYQEIRRDTLETDNDSVGENSAPTNTVTLEIIQTRLGYLYTGLTQLQNQLKKDIQVLERIMHRE